MLKEGWRATGRRLGLGLAGAASLMLAACGGDDSDDYYPVQNARFVDGAVSGLQYRCGTNGPLQLTGASGELACFRGSTVSFYIGSLYLGSVRLDRGVKIVTPVSLFDGAVDETDQRVINLARFLISLDQDQDPDNGIQIPAGALQDTDLALDFTLGEAEFGAASDTVLEALTSDVDGGPFTTVSAADAEDHLVLGLVFANSGYYEGTVQHSAEQAENPAIAVIVSRSGYIYGSNETDAGLYAAAGMDEEQGEMDTSGFLASFKVDGSTGATYYPDAQFADSAANDVEVDYPHFGMTRKITFNPQLDADTLDAFAALLPLGLDLDEGEGFVGVSIGPGDCGLSGFPYGDFTGGPASPSAENDVEYGDILVAEVISAANGVVRLVAITMAGYVIEVRADVSSEVPVVTADWKHLHDGVSGTTSVFEANIDTCAPAP